MEVKRETTIKTDHLELNDRIKVKFGDEKHFAVAVREDPDGMLFVLEDCLNERMSMNDTNTAEGGYLASRLRERLKQIAGTLPKKLKKRLVPDENGDLLWLLSLREVFGLDENLNEVDGQIEYFKDRKNRIAIHNEDLYSFWLRDVASSIYFAYCYADGDASNLSAPYALGVRPAFKIRYPVSPAQTKEQKHESEHDPSND